LRSSPWRDEVRRWHEDERPRVVGANRALQAEDPAALDDDALAAHFRSTVDNFRRSAPLHFAHSGFDVAAGLFLAAAAEWGFEPATFTELLTGSSPASSAVDALLRAVADALDRAQAPPLIASLDELRAVAAAGDALDAYLDDYGWRPSAGHDLLEPTVGERPELVLAVTNSRRRRPPATPRPDIASVVRATVPPGDQDRFDELLADMRASYALRDDDVGVCWNWPMGLIRRAGLSIGRRLADRERVAHPLHVFEAEVDEAVALLAGDGPTRAELAERWDVRARASLEEPPAHLDGGGDRAVPVAPPPAVARLSEICNAVWTVAPPRVDAPLHGVGIGSQIVLGPARVVLHPEEFTRLVDGDVLVTIATTTAFNAVFPLLSAVVTEQGGLFSHCAILSRELGLTAVVGVPDLLESVHDGDLIEVEPLSGAVRIVERAG
jgi:pyruvate,water dikinase